MQKTSLSTKFIIAAALYFLFHILLRVILSPSLDYDEAEQAMLSQWLQIGYTEQPPLYTWIQHSLFRLIGESVVAVSILKNSLLFLTYLFVFLTGKEILRDDRPAILATVSLLFIPQICWESQRDMTHTTLVVCAVAATLYLFLRIMRSPTTVNYLLLGLAMTVGILAKANYFLFTAVTCAALLSMKEGRSILLTRKFLLSLALALLLASPYLYWMYTNQDIVFSSSHKFKRGLDNYYLHGTWSLISNSFLFLTPCWFICLATFPSILKPGRNVPASSPQKKLISRYMIFFFLILLIVVLLFKVTYVKDRWLQPLLFAAPLWAFSRLNSSDISLKKFRIYLSFAGVTCIAIYLAFTLRVLAASVFDNYSRLNYPFQAITKSLREDGWTAGTIISDNRFLAGNLRLAFPDSTAIVPDYHFENNAPDRGPILIVWRADHSRQIPEDLLSFIRQTYDISPADLSPKYIEHPFLYGSKTVKMGSIFLNFSKRQHSI